MRALIRPLAFTAAMCTLFLMLPGCSKPEPDGQTAVPNTTDPQWVRQHTPHVNVALVFVHGIFGDTLGTWTNANGTSFFDLIDNDPELGPHLDMLAFGYTSRMIGAGSFDIQEAANRLHVRLDHHGVLDYPAIVFVTHSMGGLVVLRELLTHREILDRVPLVLFYATPQEGSQITTIAHKVANNPALEQMLPADRNGYLRVLNDEWKALPDDKRSRIRCAYEKRPTHGIMVVPWSSATRFCEGTTLAIDADHITISKPDRAGHDSMVLLATALKQYVLGKQLVAKLETPDFQVESNHAVLTMSDPFGKRDARLVNAGGTKLRYTLAQFPDRGLYVIPGAGPDELAPNSTRVLQFVLGYGAKDSEYRFVLTSDVTEDRTVLIRIPDLPAVQSMRQQAILDVSRDLNAVLSNEQELERLKRAPADDVEVPQRVVHVVKDAIGKRAPELAEGAQWVLSAELLNAANWPGLAVRALQNAERAEPAIVQVPGVQLLASVSASLAGTERVFASAPTKPVDVGSAYGEGAANPFTDARLLAASSQIASGMKQIPPLAAQGLSLEGDLKLARGDRRGAGEAYSDAAAIRTSPSIKRRILDLGIR